MARRIPLVVLIALALALSGVACSHLRLLAERIYRTSVPLVQRRPGAPSPCGDPPAELIHDLGVYQSPALAEPTAGSPFRDPVFGTCLTRVTDRKVDLAEDDPSPGLLNEYSRVQSFNADGTLLLARGIAATWYLYDATTLELISQLPIGGPVDPRWDAANPSLLYYTEEARLMSLNVQTLAIATLHDFAFDFPGQTLAAVWTRGEGSPSADGRYWGLMAENADWEPIALLVYDQVADQIIGRRTVTGVPDIDNVTISPLGNYFLAWYDYCEQGTLGTEQSPCGLMVWDRLLQNGRGLQRICGHGDLALDAAGREVLVYQDIDTDHISMLDLASGAVTPLWPIDFSHTALGLHVSGRALHRRGWAVVSTYNGGHPTSQTWMDDQVFLIELKAGGRVARLAHTHSLYSEAIEQDYWAEPHASANLDLTRIVFTTNWGRSGTEEVEMYLIELPTDWPQRLQ